MSATTGASTGENLRPDARASAEVPPPWAFAMQGAIERLQAQVDAINATTQRQMSALTAQVKALSARIDAQAGLSEFDRVLLDIDVDASIATASTE